MKPRSTDGSVAAVGRLRCGAPATTALAALCAECAIGGNPALYAVTLGVDISFIVSPSLLRRGP